MSLKSTIRSLFRDLSVHLIGRRRSRWETCTCTIRDWSNISISEKRLKVSRGSLEAAVPTSQLTRGKEVPVMVVLLRLARLLACNPNRNRAPSKWVANSSQRVARPARRPRLVDRAAWAMQTKENWLLIWIQLSAKPSSNRMDLGMQWMSPAN